MSAVVTKVEGVCSNHAFLSSYNCFQWFQYIPIFYVSGCEAELSPSEAAATVEAWQPMVQALQVTFMVIMI